MFFTVSGGPFGLEGLVGSVGPGVALLLLVATPLVYSVPETLLIGELASMLPVEGGYYQWVKRAFGRFWGFWNGWLSWTYSLLDMAIYPVLFIQYLRFFAPGLSQLDAWLVAVALIWGATWLNLGGTFVVGTASGWFVATVLLPFGVLTGVAIARWIGQPATPVPVTPFHAAGSSFLGALGLGVSQSIWNYSGWDNASTIGGEIEPATTTYPRAPPGPPPPRTGGGLPSGISVLPPAHSASRADERWAGHGAGTPGCAARSACRWACRCWLRSRRSPSCCSSPASRSRCGAGRLGCRECWWPWRSPPSGRPCMPGCSRAGHGSSRGARREALARLSPPSLRPSGIARNIAALRFRAARAATTEHQVWSVRGTAHLVGLARAERRRRHRRRGSAASHLGEGRQCDDGDAHRRRQRFGGRHRA